MRSIIILFFFLGFYTFLFAQEISITVTNQNLALVKEQRTLTLTKGTGLIELNDIPELIDPTSVHISSENNTFFVLEQNFEYDLLNTDKILSKSVNKKISLVHPESGKISGILLYNDGVSSILKTEDGTLKIIPRNDMQQVILEEFDQQKSDLIIKPTLVWQIDSKKSDKNKAEISYLTGGLSWHAEYVAVVNEKETYLDLASWVSIENKSGKTYTDARLKLMAGDLNLVSSRPPYQTSPRYMEKTMSIESQFSEKEFFEYHLYSLERQTTIKNNQTKQIQLFPSSAVQIDKIYNYNYQKDPQKIAVLLTFKNTKSAGLGIPLPKGKVRLYKKDEAELEFIGEDLIDHTARDEKVEIESGKAFDIVAERKIQNRQKISDRSERLTIEVSLRNHKENDVTVIVTEPLYSYRNSEILKSSHKVKEKNVDHVDFAIPVDAKGEANLTFEILYSW